MSQNLISEVILNDFPDHSIIGEEGDSLSNQSEYHWVVDPIDGTCLLYTSDAADE